MSTQSTFEPLPMACALSTDDLKARFVEIGELAGRALLGHEQEGRTLHLRYAKAAANDLERLVAKERTCCEFLQFDIRTLDDHVYLDITAPVEAGEFAPLLYAHFIGAGEQQNQVAAGTSSCACAVGTR